MLDITKETCKRCKCRKSRKNWRSIELIHDDESSLEGDNGRDFIVIERDPKTGWPIHLGYVLVRKDQGLVWQSFSEDTEPWHKLHPGYCSLNNLMYDIESVLNIGPIVRGSKALHQEKKWE